MHQKHYIIFQHTDNHCATYLVRAASLRDALTRYALEQYAGAERREDGSIAVDDGYGGTTLYAHPLACIEGEEKTHNGGLSWNGWEIRELQEAHWAAGFAEVFCSENPFEVAEHIEWCRPVLRQCYPRSRARGFVWYLKEGPLVTFYRPQKRDRPIKILARYFLPRQTFPHPQEWTGTYDDILEQMATDYPLP